MIVWLILFLLVIGISFLLAFRSMKDYHEIPHKSDLEYALFLIRSPTNLNPEFLQTFQQKSAKKGLIISFERLFKGSESALCVFGPKEVLRSIAGLNLLELEDYSSDFNTDNTSVWEVDFKAVDNPFSDLPELGPDEKFCWQVLLSGKHIQIRAAVFSKDPKKRLELVFSKLPRPFSNSQMIEFYKTRSVDKETTKELSHLKLLDLLLLH